MRTLLATLVLLVPVAAAGSDLSQCFQTIQPHDVAVLRADLDCTALGGVISVVLERGATLDMNGHSISVNADSAGIVCRSRCTIFGPGEIRGSRRAVYGERGKLVISDLDLVDNENSIDVNGRLVAERVTADSWVRGSAVEANDLDVTHADGDCLLGNKIRGTNVAVTGCHTGIAARRSVKITGLVGTGNLSAGVTARKVWLIDSMLGQNGFIDLFTTKLPRLVDTTCETSAERVETNNGLATGPSWGVCSND